MSDGIEDDWLDAELLADDPPSETRWRRKAQDNVTMGHALRALPKMAQLTVKVPIEEWRTMKRHLDATGQYQGQFIRRAVAARLVTEGVPPEKLESFRK